MLESSSYLSRWKIFFGVLTTVFAVEAAVMFLLPVLLPVGLDHRFVALADACLLTFSAAPLLWWLVVRPLRERAVTASAKAESIVAAAGEGIFTIDERGLVDTFNPAAERILGYQAAEIVGKSVESLLPLDRLQTAIDSGRRNGEETQVASDAKSFEVRGIRKDGRAVPLQLSISQSKVDGRRLCTGLFRDLTEQKHRARQQAAVVEFGKQALVYEHLDELLDKAAKVVQATLQVDCTGVFELCRNGHSLRLSHGIGWSQSSLGTAEIAVQGSESPGLAVREFVMQAIGLTLDDPGLQLLRNRQLQGVAAVLIQAGSTPYGVLAAFRETPCPLADHEMDFLRDIAVQASLAIQRQRSEMQYRERDQYRAEQMATVAQLATGVAHEIRNPLTSIKMLIQAGMRASDGMNESDLDVIQEEIRRMERSLNAFLEFARPAKAEHKLVQLTPLVDRTLALVESRACRQGITLQREACDVEVWGDEDQLQQLLLNLVLNSLDATPSGGRVWVEVKPAPPFGFHVRVNDTGPGVPDKLMSRLFQPFVSGKENGLGLGLVISRRIAESHGGTLFAANRPGGGASFTFQVPTRPQGLSPKE